MLGFFRKKDKNVEAEVVTEEINVTEEPVMAEADVMKETSVEAKEDDFDETAVIDKETGIMYCGGMEELYEEVVGQYCEQGNDYMEKVATYFEQQDWKNYQIIVHGIKGSSLTVGAVALSEMAKALEMAAKSEQIDYIQAENDSFLKSYQAVLNALKKEQ